MARAKSSTSTERPLPFPVPDAVMDALRTLWDSGHAAYLVGGGIRDGLLGREPHRQWDVATDARPERVLELFPGGAYENRFGTVLVDELEITTFRRERDYADHRRPDAVAFTDSIEEDLARRDFTVNAIAWGRPKRSADASGSEAELTFVDPFGGRADIDARVLRAVGDPDERFAEDALRLLRAARIAAVAGLEVEPATRDAMAARAKDVAHLSGERVGIELRRLLAAEKPSTGFGILEETGVLAALIPDLAAQRGVPQDKVAGHDLWDHTLATLDAAAGLAPDDEVLKMAALLHDAGKPRTFADGHFLGHAKAGAEIAQEVLPRVAYPARDTARVCRLIEEHMFEYRPDWTDAAVRRFMRRVGPDLVDDLLLLRRADNIGSGNDPNAHGLAQLRRRVQGQRAERAPLSLTDLAVDGDDLQRELARPPGPWLGRLLDRLLESVVNDPRRNTRERLLADARHWTDEGSTSP